MERFLACTIAAAVAIAGCTGSGEKAVAPSAVPVILDTDIGDDIDDSWAVALILSCPELDVKLITTAHGATDKRAQILSKYLHEAGIEVPYAPGLKTGDDDPRIYPWAKDYDMSVCPPASEDGVDLMIKEILASDREVVLIPIGPLDNIAEALRREPKIAEKCRIITMGGSIYVGYNGKREPDPEYNIKAAIPAAKAVYTATWPILMAPLDTAGTVVLEGEPYRWILGADRPLARSLISQYRLWKTGRLDGEIPDKSSVLFDTVAVWLAVDREFAGISNLRIVVDDEGFTKPVDEGGKSVQAAILWEDKPAFLDWVARRIAAMTETPKAANP
ncbi:MAG: nucleoside hydrolase [Planctomycetes bacterium]|nr:nucleoside hydrolase [Planctomycetota bacterium]